MNYRIYEEPERNPTYVVLEVDGKVIRRDYCSLASDRRMKAWWWNFRIKTGWKPIGDIYSGKIK